MESLIFIELPVEAVEALCEIAVEEQLPLEVCAGKLIRNSILHRFDFLLDCKDE